MTLSEVSMESWHYLNCRVTKVLRNNNANIIGAVTVSIKETVKYVPTYPQVPQVFIQCGDNTTNLKDHFTELELSESKAHIIRYLMQMLP